MEGRYKADPMRLALSGKSGTIIGVDYRGEYVLAAYEPVAELDLGIVAKKELSEIRRPFIHAAIVASIVGLSLIAMGGYLVLRAANPLVMKLDKNEKHLSSILASMNDGIITVDTNGTINMVNRGAEDLEQEESIPDLKKIHGAGKHLLALINDILDLSKIEAGKMELFLEEFNIEQMLDEIKSTVGTLVKKRQNQFVLDYASPLGDMHTDLTKVRQMLFNPISNAAKFTENGAVTLSTKQMSVDTQDWIEFRVSDTGIGIALFEIHNRV